MISFIKIIALIGVICGVLLLFINYKHEDVSTRRIQAIDLLNKSKEVILKFEECNKEKKGADGACNDLYINGEEAKKHIDFLSKNKMIAIDYENKFYIFFEKRESEWECFTSSRDIKLMSCIYN